MPANQFPWKNALKKNSQINFRPKFKKKKFLLKKNSHKR